MVPLFKGLQIVSKKVLDGERVELKFRFDFDPGPGVPPSNAAFSIQPMVKAGEEWKLGGSTRTFNDQWDLNGQIQILDE